MPVIRVYEDPSSVSPCAGCSAHIRWHDTLTGKRMPMDVNAVPLKSEHLDGRVVVHFDAGDSHWATCVASKVQAMNETPDLQRLKARGLVEMGVRGLVRASDVLFEGGGAA